MESSVHWQNALQLAAICKRFCRMASPMVTYRNVQHSWRTVLVVNRNVALAAIGINFGFTLGSGRCVLLCGVKLGPKPSVVNTNNSASPPLTAERTTRCWLHSKQSVTNMQVWEVGSY
eukprot:2896118-Amphidinium_carterae.1